MNEVAPATTSAAVVMNRRSTGGRQFLEPYQNPPIALPSA